MITPKNIFRHEIIGLKVEIVESPHKDFKGLKGKVIDETKKHTQTRTRRWKRNHHTKRRGNLPLPTPKRPKSRNRRTNTIRPPRRTDKKEI